MSWFIERVLGGPDTTVGWSSLEPLTFLHLFFSSYYLLARCGDSKFAEIVEVARVFLSTRNTRKRKL
jgi:hypothetical protein